MTKDVPIVSPAQLPHLQFFDGIIDESFEESTLNNQEKTERQQEFSNVQITNESNFNDTFLTELNLVNFQNNIVLHEDELEVSQMPTPTHSVNKVRRVLFEDSAQLIKKRVYKKHACFSCGILSTNIIRHLKVIHKNEENVSEAIQLSQKAKDNPGNATYIIFFYKNDNSLKS